MTAISINTGCVNVKVDGFSNFAELANVHPYAGIVAVATGTQGVDVRNGWHGSLAIQLRISQRLWRWRHGSVMVNMRLQRLYMQNTRTGPLSIANTIQNVLIESVWGDAADSQALAGVNLLAKGVPLDEQRDRPVFGLCTSFGKMLSLRERPAGS